MKKLYLVSTLSLLCREVLSLLTMLLPNPLDREEIVKEGVTKDRVASGRVGYKERTGSVPEDSPGASKSRED